MKHTCRSLCHETYRVEPPELVEGDGHWKWHLVSGVHNFIHNSIECEISDGLSQEQLASESINQIVDLVHAEVGIRVSINSGCNT